MIQIDPAVLKFKRIDHLLEVLANQEELIIIDSLYF